MRLQVLPWLARSRSAISRTTTSDLPRARMQRRVPALALALLLNWKIRDPPPATASISVSYTSHSFCFFLLVQPPRRANRKLHAPRRSTLPPLPYPPISCRQIGRSAACCKNRLGSLQPELRAVVSLTATFRRPFEIVMEPASHFARACNGHYLIPRTLESDANTDCPYTM
jgi:hypothetical protein